MVKGILRGWLGVKKNEEVIADNAAIDAVQAVDITNNTAINAAQTVDITKLTTENAAQAVDITKLTAENAAQTEELAKLAEAVGEQEKIMATCIIVSAVAAIAITCFVAFCIYQGVKCEKEKEKNSLDQDTPKGELNGEVDTQAQQDSLHIPN